MKLREHPGFVDAWPGEPGGPVDRYYVSPIARRDVLSEVILQIAVGSDSPSVVLRTMYQGKQSTRDNRVRDDKFAKELADFLKTQIGKTIEEIGETEVNF
jgi:hypothetical protein